MILKKFINWFKNKSIETSSKNIQECLENLVVVANEAYCNNLQHAGKTDPSDIRKVQNAKDQLIIQLCGPIPLEEVKKNFINPILNSNNLTEGARMAINHAFDCVEKKIKKE